MAVALLALALMPVARPAGAAELKITLAELARILTVTIGDAKLRLHNVPAGLLDATAGSSLTVGGASFPVPIAPRDFDFGGTKFAYYINNLNSGTITISAVPSALRFTIPFVTSGPALVGKCASGFCVSDEFLPEIRWSGAVVTLDFTPVWSNGDFTLFLKAVNIGGTFTPDCNSAHNLLSGGVCDFALPQARTAARTLKTDLAKTLTDKVNAADTQEKLASGLRSYLKFGPAGEAKFQTVTVDPTTLTLTFCLACAGGGT